MIAALLSALLTATVYAVLAGCAPVLAGDLGWVYAIVIVSAWSVLLRRVR